MSQTKQPAQEGISPAHAEEGIRSAKTPGDRTRLSRRSGASKPGIPVPPFPAEWQKIEELSDLLAEYREFELALEAALRFIAGALDRPGGILVIQSPSDPNPVLTVCQNIPAALEAQLSGSSSALRRLCREVVESCLPAMPDSTLELAGAVPICSLSSFDRTSNGRGAASGVLLLCGKALSEGEMGRLARLSSPVHRVIRTHRSGSIPGIRQESEQAGSKQPLNKQAKELAALRLASEVISSGLEFDEMDAWMVKGVCHILDAEAGTLMQIDEEESDLLIKKTLGENSQWVYQANLRLGSQSGEKGIEEQCICSGTPLRINDLSSSAYADANSQVIPNLKLRSILCAPLMVNEQVVGAIAVHNKRSGPFTQEDEELLTNIATSIANAIYNTRLIQQLKVANADLEASRWQLLRSRNTLRALFDSIPASIYIIDPKYNLVALNMTLSSMAHSKPNTLVGRQCYEALYNQEDICPGCRVMETLLSGQNTTRTRREWENDDPMEWEISTYPIRDETGEVIQAILLEQDVTEKRRLEATLAQSEKLAAVGQLAAGVAHEINNPLTAIIANAQMLQRELPADDERQELVELIAKAGNRATQVVRNLLDFARKEHYEFAPTDMNETIRRALALIQHELMSRAVYLSFEPDEDLPLVLASHDHMQGVWLNLIMNAIDAMEGPTRQAEMRIVTRQMGSEVRVTISDNGKGIPAERLSRIFEPFYTTKSPGRGTGLGLSVCHRIVKQHGGHITVNSQVGKGTEFTVVLPAA